MDDLDPIQQQLLWLLFEQFFSVLSDEQDTTSMLPMLLLLTEMPIPRSFVKRANIDRGRTLGHERLMRDYFIENPVYGPDMFRRRFRMRKPLFERIQAAVASTNEYFVQGVDALGIHGLSSVQKVTAAIRMLAYDKSTDELDEHLRLGESTSLRCVKEFCKTVISVFGEEYLRAPTAADLERILRHSASRGFPGMIGSLDCMHWDWKNCPQAWAGQFGGRSGSNSCVLEAVATYDLWIWHAFFGMPGTNNDINVLDRSPLFRNLLAGIAPSASFVVNNKSYNMCYMLTDGIYPNWPVFVHTISQPQTEKRKYFAQRQESARKDIERCFGVLRARWSILKNPTRLWRRSTLHNVITACIILHNMIVEDEHDTLLHSVDHSDIQVRSSRDPHLPPVCMARFLATRTTMRNQQAANLLQSDLVEHLWAQRGHDV